MKTKTVSLAFEGPVHFGRGRLSDSGYAFDAGTLFSALYIEALHMGVEGELLEAAREGELTLSDAFPYRGTTRYLPKPMVSPEVFDERNRLRERQEAKMASRERKANKKLAYVPAQRYGGYLRGTFDSVAEMEHFSLGTSYMRTSVSLTSVGHDDEAGPYAVGGFSFRPGAGLYFLVRGDYDLMPLLEQLSYAGLGGKRTVGYGRFQYAVEDADPIAEVRKAALGALPHGSNVLLSTAMPRSEELDDALLQGARYRLVRRGGFVQSATHVATPHKKRDMYCFAAGSTFARTFQGDVFDVNTLPGAHPVYRYARALWMEV